MIITNIIGGLGNQMFQYAAARALSIERAKPLRLDISEFSGYGLHQGFELQRIFSCPIEIANDAEVRRILCWQSSHLFRRVMLRPSMTIFRLKSLVVEPHFHYWMGLKKAPSDAYLTGYWQTEKYFSDVALQIREDFSFRSPMEGKNIEFAKHISQVNSVSLHVRRGDYAKNPKTLAMHGLCSLGYYYEAIKHISKKVHRPHFFIFSDDMAWVKKNLKINFPCIYVEHNQGGESYNDMRLMSLCRHHIIANSSFSWWGAWLNPSVDKIVIAPRRWFLSKKINSTDLIPVGWTSL